MTGPTRRDRHRSSTARCRVAGVLALALATGCGSGARYPGRTYSNVLVAPTVTVVEWLPGDVLRVDGAHVADVQTLADHVRAARAEHPHLGALLVTPPEAPHDRVAAIRDVLLAADLRDVAHVQVRDLGAPPPPRAEPAAGPAVAPPPLGAARWTCWYPLEAIRRDVDGAAVILRVLVGPDGIARGVQTLSDPGAGFGRVAAACATIKPYNPAEDAHGQRVEAMTPKIRLHFAR